MRSHWIWVYLFLCHLTPWVSSTLSSLRLPKSLRPIHYRLKLIPHFVDYNFTTFGEARITLKCLEETKSVIFHSKDLTIKEIHLNGDDFQYQLVKLEYDNDKEMHQAVLNEPLHEGKVYELFIKYKFVLNDLLQGFYRSKYQISTTNETRWIATTQFSPTDARRAFPCWDEPSFKALFTISIGRHANMTSLSNMPLQSTVEMPNKPEWFWDKYETSLPMSTYFVAFMVMDFAHVHVATKDNKFILKLWSREEAIKQTKYVAQIAPKILSFFEDYFNISFPLAKLDMVALPDFGFSGMENWGLITFRESAMLSKGSDEDSDERLLIGGVVAHEIAHQWFGNLVTPTWWDDLWLKEGFASYMGIMARDQVEPTLNHMDRFVVKSTQMVLGPDSLKSSHRVSLPIEDPKDIRQMFDVISYKKGASIIRMMDHMIGNKQFKEGLTDYLEQYSFKDASQSDLWAALAGNKTQPKDGIWLARAMDTWTLQTGYPVVTVTRNYSNGTALFQQARYLLSGEVSNSSLWWVPITYSYCSQLSLASTQPDLWLTPEEKSATVGGIPEEDCLLVNINSTGFYRVNYDKKNWKMLSDKFPEFPPLTQSQLMSDGFSLAQSGELSYEPVFRMLRHLGDSDNYLPWSTVYDELTFLFYLLRGSSAHDDYKRLVLSLLPDESLHILGGNYSKGPSNGKNLRILQIQLAGLVGERNITEESADYLANLMASSNSNNSTEIDVDLQFNLYCSAISAGSDKEWNFVWESYLSSDVSVTKETLLKALTCTNRPTTIERYLGYLLDSKSGVRKQDGSTVFQYIVKNELGTDLAVDFLFNKWEQFLQYYGLAFNKIADMVTSLRNLKNEFQLQKVENFYEKLKIENKLGTTEKSFQKAIESIKINVEWLQNRFGEFSSFLNQREI